MATKDFDLVAPPRGERDLELWLQHAAGFIMLQDIRGYAIERLEPSLSAEARAAALKAIDDSLDGLMMVIDGVTGGLQRDDIAVDLRTSVRLCKGGAVVKQLDLIDGDGVCMGYHGWLKGDFGEHPVARPRGSRGTVDG